MLPDKFIIHHVSYYEPARKIWGWFTNPDDVTPNGRWGVRKGYCFWAVVGKTISMNRHVIMSGNMEAMAQRKIANKYQEIDESALLEMWPTFREDLSNRYVFHLLRDSI